MAVFFTVEVDKGVKEGEKVSLDIYIMQYTQTVNIRLQP